jgi:hypothetical protein
VGFADTAPQKPNDTEEGRASNRRVDIVIQNQYMAKPPAFKTAAQSVNPPAAASRSVSGQEAK